MAKRPLRGEQTPEELSTRIAAYVLTKAGANRLRWRLNERWDEMFWPGATRKPTPEPPEQLRLSSR